MESKSTDELALDNGGIGVGELVEDGMRVSGGKGKCLLGRKEAKKDEVN